MTALVYKKITDYVSHFAQKTPRQTALVFDGERINYAQLQDLVITCSKALLASGVKKGDRVAMLCSPCTEFYVSFLATANIGAIWVGLNPKYSLNEFRHAIEDAKPKILIAMARISDRDYQQELKTLNNENDFLKSLVLINFLMEDTQDYETFLAKNSEISAEVYFEAIDNVSRLDPALIVYTSGSTGKPKGAVLSHYGLSFGASVQSQHFNVQDPSIICNMPINHVASVADICCTTLVVGGTIYFQESFDASLMLKTITQEKIKIWAGVPTMFLLQINQSEFESTDFSSVELIVWGGSAMPENAIKILQKLSNRLKVLYGMTETSAHTIYTDENASLSDLRDSIGFPDKRMPCRIINEEGEKCKTGEQGELQFKGEYLMLGYFNRPEETEQAFTDDGWFHSGDLAYWREDGSVTLVGRMSEMYKSGGYNIYPREIEKLLETHPSVNTAAVISIPDKVFQEIGVAFVSPKPGLSITELQLVEFCKGSLANYKVPKYFIILSEMPRLAIGKIDKNELKNMMKNQSVNNGI